MLQRARQRMIAGVNRAAGRADCSEAVVLQRRNGPALLVLMAVFVVVMTIVELRFDLNSLVNGAIAGLTVGGGITLLTDNFWLGRCGDTVILIKVNALQNKAQHVVAQYQDPVIASFTDGFPTAKVWLFDTEYVMAKQMEARFRAVTAPASTS